MAIPALKVELGFDLTESISAPFFKLNDNIQGRLDNSEYRLGGTLFVDVTERVISVDVQRGKSNILAYFPPAEASVELNNHDRAFDPLYTLSPYYGNIVPRREMKISSNNELVFQGWIEDWDLGYQPSGDSVTVAKAFDALNVFANQTMDGFTPPVEKAGERINRVLDLPEVNWPSGLRDIETGVVDMADNTVSDDTNVLSYMQNISLSEPGNVFLTRDGKIAFRDRRSAPTSASLVTFGEGGIPSVDFEVVYGSELLYNRITVSRQNGGTAIASDVASQNAYGIRDLSISDVQLNSDGDLIDYVLGYADQYSQPEYRFDGLSVNLEKISTAEQNQVLSLDIGSVCAVVFTPNNVPPQIVRYVEVTRIDHNIQTQLHRVRLGFSQLRYQPLVLDDAVFGKLDVGTLSW